MRGSTKTSGLIFLAIGLALTAVLYIWNLNRVAEGTTPANDQTTETGTPAEAAGGAQDASTERQERLNEAADELNQ